MYKKDQSHKIALLTATTFGIGIVLFNVMLQPFSALEQNFKQLERCIEEDKWDEAQVLIEEVEQKWTQYEVIIRVANQYHMCDRFERELEACAFLIESEDEFAMNHIGMLQYDLEEISRVIPAP